MASLHALLISMLMVGTSGLQTQMQSGIWHDWHEMVKAFDLDKTLKIYQCHSDQYKQFVGSMPPVDFSRMRIPHNKRILFYGTSLLHQTLQNILVANGDTLIKDGPFGMFEGVVIDRDEKNEEWVGRAHQAMTYKEYERLMMGGYVVEWNFTTGSSILEVQNFRALQDAGDPHSVGNLRKFMKEHTFDVAFFMNPHPVWKMQEKMHADRVKCVKECNARDEPNVSCGNDVCPDRPPDSYLERTDMKGAWDVIYAAMRGKVYQVEEWDQNTALPLDLFHADESHAVQTYGMFENNFCNVEDKCFQHEHNLGGHQCQPGPVIPLSEKLVKLMKSH